MYRQNAGISELTKVLRREGKNIVMTQDLRHLFEGLLANTKWHSDTEYIEFAVLCDNFDRYIQLAKVQTIASADVITAFVTQQYSGASLQKAPNMKGKIMELGEQKIWELRNYDTGETYGCDDAQTLINLLKQHIAR